MKKPVPANSGAQKPPSQLRFSLPSIIVHRKRIEIHESQRFLSTDTTKALVHAFVTSRVDYCNSLLYGLPASHLNKVQRVLNAAARLVCRAPRYCRITPLLYELHWLPVRQRISFKILLFVFKAIHGFAPTYLKELVSIKRSGNYNLRSSSDDLLLATPTYRSSVTLGRSSGPLECITA